MELIPFLVNNPLMLVLGLAGIFLVSLAARLGRFPAPIRIPVREQRDRRKLS